MKLVYLGSPDAAVPPLRALVAAGHHVLLVVSQPDRRRGRGSSLMPSPVKAAALELGLPVTDEPNDVLAAVAEGAELGVVVAYGKLIRQPLLDAIPFLNIHFSLLPRWRGAAPVERAILAGDTETGVCLMGLEAGLDTGPVYRRIATPIDHDEPVGVLRDRLVAIGTELLVDSLAHGIGGLGPAEPQSGEATYAQKLQPSEFVVDWTQSAEAIHRLVRLGFAWTTFRGKRLKVLAALVDGARVAGGPGTLDGVLVATGAGALRLVTVQPEGKGAMDATAWRNGVQPQPGERLETVVTS